VCAGQCTCHRHHTSFNFNECTSHGYQPVTHSSPGVSLADASTALERPGGLSLVSLLTSGTSINIFGTHVTSAPGTAATAVANMNHTNPNNSTSGPCTTLFWASGFECAKVSTGKHTPLYPIRLYKLLALPRGGVAARCVSDSPALTRTIGGQRHTQYECLGVDTAINRRWHMHPNSQQWGVTLVLQILCVSASPALTRTISQSIGDVNTAFGGNGQRSCMPKSRSSTGQALRFSSLNAGYPCSVGIDMLVGPAPRALRLPGQSFIISKDQAKIVPLRMSNQSSFASSGPSFPNETICIQKSLFVSGHLPTFVRCQIVRRVQSPCLFRYPPNQTRRIQKSSFVGRYFPTSTHYYEFHSPIVARECPTFQDHFPGVFEVGCTSWNLKTTLNYVNQEVPEQPSPIFAPGVCSRPSIFPASNLLWRLRNQLKFVPENSHNKASPFSRSENVQIEYS